MRRVAPCRKRCADASGRGLNGRITDDANLVIAVNQALCDPELRRHRAAAFPHRKEESTHLTAMVNSKRLRCRETWCLLHLFCESPLVLPDSIPEA